MKVLLYISIIIIYSLLLSYSASGQIYASSQNISGVINTYTKVTAIGASCSLTVASISGFAVGNKVLIIQMQGADIDLSNSATFGNMTAINDAGNYEFAVIADITGSNITFTKDLVRTYTTSGSVQLVTVPQYNGGAVVTGTLTAQNWNGITGGVLVFETGTITLNANIDVTGKGFRRGVHYGGAASSGDASYRSPDNGTYSSGTSTIYIDCSSAIASDNPSAWSSVCSGSWRNAGNSGCGCTVVVPGCINPYQTDPLTYASGTQFTCSGYNFSTGNPNAEKGESITLSQSWYSRGRGKIANGGGGGNQHNGGGGGGSNYGAGGIGGRGLGGTTSPDFAQGIGGVALSGYYNSNKIFMGGGGGAGQGNDNRAIPGANGGGIIIIKANTLQNSSGSKIMANGEDNNYASPNSGGYDGAGGGGGGGAVLLNINSYANITVEAKGGKGADNLFAVSGGDCYAPGGGGGGGAIRFSQAATPAGVTTLVTGGAAGVQTTPSGCVGAYTFSYGAQAGTAGGVVNNLTLPAGTVNCSLPVEMIYFNASLHDDKVMIDWKTASEINNDRFEILRSQNLENWEMIGTVEGNGNSSHMQSYLFFDNSPPLGIIYYKIRQVDFDGTFYDTHIEVVSREKKLDGIIEIFPNPLSEGNSLYIHYYALEDGILDITLRDVLGKTIFKKDTKLLKGLNQITLDIGHLAKGSYFLTMSSLEKKSARKVIVY